MTTSLLERYTTNIPDTGKVNTNGKDKTPISDDGGKDLLTDIDLIKQVNARPIGNGAGGYNDSKIYSTSITSKREY